MQTESFNEMASEIAAAVKARRRELEIDQRDLAAVAQVAVRTVSQIENGKPTTRLDVLSRVLGALGLELDVVRRRTVWVPGAEK